MIMSLLYGNTSWTVAFAVTVDNITSETLVAPNAAADRIYIFSVRFRENCRFKTGAKPHAAGFTYSTKTGERHQLPSLEGWIKSESGDEGYQSWNRIKAFIMEHHESGDSPIYLIAKRATTPGGTKRAALFYEKTTKRYACRGFFRTYDMDDPGTENIKIRIQFVECWN